MYPLVETIQLKNGWFYNLPLHELRMNMTMKELFGNNSYIEIEAVLRKYLSEYIAKNGEDCLQGKHKCRLLYTKEINSVEIETYEMKRIKSLQMVYDDEFDYTYKSTDRTALQKLFAQRKNADDILIIKHGLVTDTSFANILFFDGETWFTPKHPLLKGTKRQLLLNTGVIEERDIKPQDIPGYKKARIVNAMIDFEDEVEIKCDNVQNN